MSIKTFDEIGYITELQQKCDILKKRKVLKIETKGMSDIKPKSIYLEETENIQRKLTHKKKPNEFAT